MGENKDEKFIYLVSFLRFWLVPPVRTGERKFCDTENLVI